MADCYGCPYRWHDSDCEYCSARGDEIIDNKSYSKNTCPYYDGPKSSSSSSSSTSLSSSSSSGLGCLVGIVVFILIIGFAAYSSGLLNGIIKKDAEYTESVKYATVTADSGLNLRERATTNSKAITVIPKGTKVEVIEIEEDWVNVKYDGCVGWCYSEYLDIEE